MEPFWWALLIFGGFFLALFMQGPMGDMTLPASYVFYFSIIVLLWESDSFVRTLQYKSPQLMVYNDHTSTCGKCYPCGEYNIWTTGDIDYGIKKQSKTGAWITPRLATNKLGSEVALPINLYPVRVEQLPPLVRVKLKEIGIKPPYKMGFCSERLELAEPDKSRMELEIIAQNELINKLTNVDTMKKQMTETEIEHAKRLQEKSQSGKGGIIDKWVKGKKGEE